LAGEATGFCPGNLSSLAGIPVSSPGLVLVNNTIAENASAGGSAIFDGGFDTNMTVENNLIIGQAGETAYLCQQLNGNTAPAVFAHNDVFASGSAAIAGTCVATGTNGNISLDPQFVGAVAGNLHLQSHSPAIDAGSNSAPDLPLKDLDGFARIENKIVDIGAYEFFPGQRRGHPLEPRISGAVARDTKRSSAGAGREQRHGAFISRRKRYRRFRTEQQLPEPVAGAGQLRDRGQFSADDARSA
jgi:hypothetical protein